VAAQLAASQEGLSSLSKQVQVGEVPYLSVYQDLHTWL
jgi:hypothetical protein